MKTLTKSKYDPRELICLLSLWNWRETSLASLANWPWRQTRAATPSRFYSFSLFEHPWPSSVWRSRWTSLNACKYLRRFVDDVFEPVTRCRGKCNSRFARHCCTTLKISVYKGREKFKRTMTVQKASTPKWSKWSVFETLCFWCYRLVYFLASYSFHLPFNFSDQISAALT